MIAVLAAALVTVVPPALPSAVSAICIGEKRTATARNADVAGTTRAETSADVVEIKLSAGVWRVRAPAQLVPMGGMDGWRPLQNVKLDDRAVSGVVSFRLVERMTVTLDRLTGRLTLKGAAGSFSGMCDTLSLGGPV